MKHYLQVFDLSIWIIIAIMQWVLLWWATHKGMFKLARSYVLFLGFVAVQSTVLYAIANFLAYKFYFWTFYLGSVIEAALLIVVLYDVFKNVFSPLSSLPPRTVANLLTSIAVIAIVSITMAIWQPATKPDAIAALARTFQRTTNFVVVLSFWSVVLYARKLGIPWRSRIASITAGFLLYLSIQSITLAILGFAPQHSFPWLNRVGIFAYLASLAIWFHAVQIKEREIELPTPAALLQLRNAVAQMRSDSNKLTVQGKTRWIEE